MVSLNGHHVSYNITFAKRLQSASPQFVSVGPTRFQVEGKTVTPMKDEADAGAPDAVGDQFGLEGVDERLGNRVVVGVADRSDRLQNLVVVELLLEGEAVH